MIIMSLDRAALTLWLTSDSGLFYSGAFKYVSVRMCVRAGDWAQGADLMEPMEWLHWKG